MDSLIKDLIDRTERLARELGKGEGAVEMLKHQIESRVAKEPEVVYRDAPAKPVSAEKKAALERIKLNIAECNNALLVGGDVAYFGNAAEANLTLDHLKALLED